MARCKKCGKELPNGVKFCKECGSPIESDIEAMAGVKSASSPRVLFPVKIIVVVLFAIGLLAYLLPFVGIDVFGETSNATGIELMLHISLRGNHPFPDAPLNYWLILAFILGLSGIGCFCDNKDLKSQLKSSVGVGCIGIVFLVIFRVSFGIFYGLEVYQTEAGSPFQWSWQGWTLSLVCFILASGIAFVSQYFIAEVSSGTLQSTSADTTEIPSGTKATQAEILPLIERTVLEPLILDKEAKIKRVLTIVCVIAALLFAGIGIASQQSISPQDDESANRVSSPSADPVMTPEKTMPVNPANENNPQTDDEGLSESWVYDPMDMIPAAVEEQLLAYNAYWNENYQSVTAVAAIEDSLEAEEVETYARGLMSKWGLGENDMILLIYDNGDACLWAYNPTMEAAFGTNELDGVLDKFEEDPGDTGGDSALLNFFVTLDDCYSKAYTFSSVEAPILTELAKSYIGTWENVSDSSCVIEVSPQPVDGYFNIEISWWVGTQYCINWTYAGVYNDNTGGIDCYHGSRSDFTKDGMTPFTEDIYADLGEAELSLLNDDYLEWINFSENMEADFPEILFNFQRVTT